MTAPPPPRPSYETLSVTKPSEWVYQVELNRPDKSNAMNRAFWRCEWVAAQSQPDPDAQRGRGWRREIAECFDALAADPDCRAVVLSGAGKNFTGGLDLEDHAEVFMASGDAVRGAGASGRPQSTRRAFFLRRAHRYLRRHGAGRVAPGVRDASFHRPVPGLLFRAGAMQQAYHRGGAQRLRRGRCVVPGRAGGGRPAADGSLTLPPSQGWT